MKLYIPLLAIILLVPTPIAWACKIAPRPIPEYMAKADMAFEGTVIELKSSSDKTVITFAVSSVKKGKLSDRIQVVTGPNSASCGLGDVALPGEKWLIFASGNPLTTDLTMGSQHIFLAPKIEKGMTLKELEKLNGKPFTLNGFECDDGGAVCSWDGGALDAYDKEHTWVQLGIADEQFKNPVNSKLFDAVLGCKCYPSSSDAMQKLNPKVFKIKSNISS